VLGLYFNKKSLGKQGVNKLSDEEVINLYLKSRSSSYFTMLYSRYSGKVYSKCISLLKDEQLSDDATQDIFLKIYLNLAKFSGKSKFSTWVYSITYNYCIDYIRRKKKERNIFSEDIENVGEPLEDINDSELLEIEVSRLKKVLNVIPVGDRAVLLMKYQDDMSIRDIAGVLEKSESAIKMKIKRAKHKAKSSYKDLYKD